MEAEDGMVLQFPILSSMLMSVYESLKSSPLRSPPQPGIQAQPQLQLPQPQMQPQPQPKHQVQLQTKPKQKVRLIDLTETENINDERKKQQVRLIDLTETENINDECKTKDIATTPNSFTSQPKLPPTSVQSPISHHTTQESLQTKKQIYQEKNFNSDTPVFKKQKISH